MIIQSQLPMHMQQGLRRLSSTTQRLKLLLLFPLTSLVAQFDSGSQGSPFKRPKECPPAPPISLAAPRWDQGLAAGVRAPQRLINLNLDLHLLGGLLLLLALFTTALYASRSRDE